ncbi:LuxR C-terminal-related transcriptional regulator [Amycolatopsis sp. PS_44_ISF1]|uniref:helix-turn-helix transcriptional regulator n=1 Tax=Amycolatopsis sp. PS_44_ISF1 TaxID=2974917 RepID=UPI0028DFE371|nr:LuxR C-terminal-related transcriptional regulator [Amycolatopsis sp. PS_44_ISF1]MDT8912060.1 LuxR C-terminal-related transcriptional regulator [Amycolatopsis sp. PS_44_ISF1]
MTPIRVLIQAHDPIKAVGVAAMLRSTGQIEIVTKREQESADVLLVIDEHARIARLAQVRQWRESGVTGSMSRCVLVTDRFDKEDLLFAVQCGVMSILPGKNCTGGRLALAVIGTVRGHSLLPRGLQLELVRQIDILRRDVLEPNSLTLSRLDLRELNIIRLLADGFSSAEIASKLSWSEGQVKKVLTEAMRRLGLATRPHAVAYALRSGALA